MVSLAGKNAVFMDPVRVLSADYSHYSVSSERYYSRSMSSFCATPSSAPIETESGSRKRKRRKRVYTPNEKEALAECRHQEIRGAILEAYEGFQSSVVSKTSLICDCSSDVTSLSEKLPASPTGDTREDEVDFVKLAELWQAPLYEISQAESSVGNPSQGQIDVENEERQTTRPLFNSVIENVSKEEVVVECAGCKFLLPSQCRFLISDIAQVHQLIPGAPLDGFSLVVIDPPWENRSVKRRALHPTLPNRFLLSLPVQQLARPDGALIALWITNREKLRQFAEEELFPAWGVMQTAVWYWLKVTEKGDMVSPLDLAHHKPYECLLLGYLPCHQLADAAQKWDCRKMELQRPPDKFVIITVPGDHSRKPPLGSLLADYAPGPKPVKGLELFARELTTGWTSWGNEPLRFQNLRRFQMKGYKRGSYQSCVEPHSSSKHQNFENVFL